MKELATIMLCIVGWAWTIRAGIKVASWSQSGSADAKRVAIGNAIVSVIPFAVAVLISWPNSN